MKRDTNSFQQRELSDSGFPAIDRLFRTSAYDRNNWETHFILAMAEAYAYHLKHSREFRGHVELDQNAPRVIATMTDVEQIPWIFVQNFKEAELLSVPKSEILLTLTSSGTSGTKTQNHFDKITLNRYPLIDNLNQLRALDGWLVSAIHRAVRQRGKLLLTHGFNRLLDFPFNVSRKNLVEVYRRKIVHGKPQYDVPSMSLLHGALTQAVKEVGIRRVMNSRSIEYDY